MKLQVQPKIMIGNECFKTIILKNNNKALLIKTQNYINIIYTYIFC